MAEKAIFKMLFLIDYDSFFGGKLYRYPDFPMQEIIKTWANDKGYTLKKFSSENDILYWRIRISAFLEMSKKEYFYLSLEGTKDDLKEDLLSYIDDHIRRTKDKSNG